MPNSKAKNMNTAIKRSDAAVRFDNHWRQNLGIGDPNDPEQFAMGLLKEYTEDAIEIEVEKSGEPRSSVVIDQVTVSEGCASGEEAERAIDDMERDLRTLTQNSNLKDIDVELEAWGRAIRRIAADGINSAQYALDPRQRDRAYSARRGLGDYARLARYVGALTKSSNEDYRQLAQSLDVVSSLILVLMGEAQAEAGVRAGQFLLQVPAGELQVRRDAVLNALRALTGSVIATTDNYLDGDHKWPRGLEAYRQFCAYLDQAGLTDLRSLCDEHTLAHQLNELVDMASGGTQDGLRALGATAHVTVLRIRRLLHVGQYLVRPESPPFARFMSALALFIEGFDNGSAGNRLLFVARPPILLYGHYGINSLDAGSRYLLELIGLRNGLAEKLDCYMSCDCDVEHVLCQILLDKILFDTDRAIDLYTMGDDEDGAGFPEQRAAGYGAVIDAFIDMFVRLSKIPCISRKHPIYKDLKDIRKRLGWAKRGAGGERAWDRGNGKRSDVYRRMHTEICAQLHAEREWEQLVRRMAPSCRQPLVFPPGALFAGTKLGSKSWIEIMLQNKKPPGALNLIRKHIRKKKNRPSCKIDALIPSMLETSAERALDAIDKTGRARK